MHTSTPHQSNEVAFLALRGTSAASSGATTAERKHPPTPQNHKTIKPIKTSSNLLSPFQRSAKNRQSPDRHSAFGPGLCAHVLGQPDRSLLRRCRLYQWRQRHQRHLRSDFWHPQILSPPKTTLIPSATKSRQYLKAHPPARHKTTGARYHNPPPSQTLAPAGSGRRHPAPPDQQIPASPRCHVFPASSPASRH